MENKDFGIRLASLMNTKNISNQYLTEKAGISKNNVGNYKNGQIPNAKTLYDISQILGTSMEYLLTGKEAADLTPEEQDLLLEFRGTNQEGKDKDLIFCRDMRKIYPADPEGVSTSKLGRTGTND